MKKRTCNKTAALCGLILLAISSAVLGGCGKSEILAPVQRRSCHPIQES